MYKTKVCSCCLIEFTSDESKSSHRKSNQCVRCRNFLRVLRRFSLSKSDYNKLLERQRYCCPICSKSLDLSNAVLDHSHITNKIRGILCRKCNTLLGMSVDSIKNLRNAIKYLINAGE